jgi:hypothetical protein
MMELMEQHQQVQVHNQVVGGLLLVAVAVDKIMQELIQVVVEVLVVEEKVVLILVPLLLTVKMD